MQLEKAPKQPELQVGDVVRLINAGPEMTVVRVVMEQIATMWFQGADLHTAEFPRASVRLA